MKDTYYITVLRISIIFTQVTSSLSMDYLSTWEKWSKWSECSVTCGYGTSSRYRVWRENGKISNYTFRDIRECWIQTHCPVHGSWGRWSDWDSCTSMCNGGIHRRGRICNVPQPQHGGRDCMGAKWEMKECNKEQCPPIPPDFKLSSCTTSTFVCESKRHCVGWKNRCDGKLDCHDGTDEKKCLIFSFNFNGGSPLTISRTTVFIAVIYSLQTLVYVHR